MAASPINPSDLGFIRGGYGFKKSYPIVPGFEGSGTVVAAGPGLLPQLWLGKCVACAVSATGCTWAEYLVTRAMLCVPLPKDLSLEQGAMMLVNPLSVLTFFDIVKREKHSAIVNTASTRALGKMVIRLGRRYHIPVINIVWRKEQANLLYSMGAEFVLQSNDANFVSAFRTHAQRLNATLILDAMRGRLARQLLDAAPARSTLLEYANLSGEELVLNPRELMGGDKRVTGFCLGNWATPKSIFQTLKDTRRVQFLGNSDLQSTFQKRLPLSDAQRAVNLYQRNMTAGKILLVADREKIRVEKL
jgi:NADPH2:quinone reductase